MKFLKQTWRWYGPTDSVSLQDVKQAGATGVVTALHHIPHGEVWPLTAIQERKNCIEAQGLSWDVVESVPVHESIKTGAEDADVYLANYKQTLENLAACGIYTVCYNFMPVLDWTRTQLDLLMPDGSKALNFDWIDLALFDIYILAREGALTSYPEAIQLQASALYKAMDEDSCLHLKDTILQGIPGEKNTSLEELRQSIARYAEIGADGIRANLKKFLHAIAEVCTTTHIKMTIHPDDPPFSILGLPRIACNLPDLSAILDSVNQPFNGICFCTGSLGAHPSNDLPAMFRALHDRIYFVHLRNVKRNDLGSFHEADHLDGDVDMFAVVSALVVENQNRINAIPFRPDHGHQMLDDLHKITHPGYSAIGRLRGLAEIRGLELGILRAMKS